MMDIAAPAKPSAPKAITTKHLAYAFAEQHQIAKNRVWKWWKNSLA